MTSGLLDFIAHLTQDMQAVQVWYNFLQMDRQPGSAQLKLKQTISSDVVCSCKGTSLGAVEVRENIEVVSNARERNNSRTLQCSSLVDSLRCALNIQPCMSRLNEANQNSG